jgi:hypothetical protein
VRDAIASHGCSRVWARGSGTHVLVGLPGDEAFARLTPLAGSAFGLAFRSPSVGDGASQRKSGGPASVKWEPLLLVDELAELVEHALVAVDAVGI